MLSDNDVLEFIKADLLFPFQKLEWSDERILSFVKKFTLKRTFSQYIPNKTKVYLDTKDPNVITGRQNEYIIRDPDDESIISVVDFISGNVLLLFGHPPIGTFSYGALENWYLRVSEARTTHLSSPYLYTIEFLPPNTIWISPNPGEGVIIYERSHPHFGTIPPEMEYRFLRLANAEIKMKIGKIRKRFTGIETSMTGAIPLNGDDMYTEGKEEYDTVIEELKTVRPNIIIDLN